MRGHRGASVLAEALALTTPGGGVMPAVGFDERDAAVARAAAESAVARAQAAEPIANAWSTEYTAQHQPYHPYQYQHLQAAQYPWWHGAGHAS